MEKDLEHKVNTTYQKIDANTSYPRKDELWNRLDNKLNKRKGVPLYWRVAAIFLAMFLITGAIASFIGITYEHDKFKLLENENRNLLRIVDSLQNSQPAVITEIQYKEKEVPVYITFDKEDKSQNADKEQNEVLRKENEKLIKQFEFEKELFQEEIDSLQLELLALKEKNIENTSAAKEENKNPQLIKLKSENYDTLYQRIPTTENPKIKLQIFSNPDNKKNFDLNTTILKQ